MADKSSTRGQTQKGSDPKNKKAVTKEAEIINTPPLPEQLAKKKADLLAAQQGLGSTLQNPHAIKGIKKDIARIMTKINATKGDN